MRSANIINIAIVNTKNIVEENISVKSALPVASKLNAATKDIPNHAIDYLLEAVNKKKNHIVI